MSTWVDLPGWLLYLWKLQEPKALSTSRVAVSVHAGFDRANLTFLHALLLQDEDSFRSDKPRLHELHYSTRFSCTCRTQATRSQWLPACKVNIIVTTRPKQSDTTKSESSNTVATNCLLLHTRQDEAGFRSIICATLQEWVVIIVILHSQNEVDATHSPDLNNHRCSGTIAIRRRNPSLVV